MIHNINCNGGDLSFDEFYTFMITHKDEFITPLEKQVVDLTVYINKLYAIGTIAYQRKTGKGKVVGVVIGYTDHTPDNTSYVTQVVVSPEDRGIGIAQQLLNEYEAVCKIKHLRQMWLTTEVNNQSAKRAYEKYGFIASGTNEKGLIIYRKSIF